MRVLLVALLIVIAVRPVSAATWSPLERDFVRILPASGADLNTSRLGSRSWRVRFNGDRVEVIEASPRIPGLPFLPEIDMPGIIYYGTQPTQVLRVIDSWFLAYNHGEFGGGLWQFNGDGSVGRMLLERPTYDLLPFGDEVLAATGSAAPFFFKPLRIHRFALRGGSWQEVGHTDFDHNITTLTNLGGQLYGIAGTADFIAALSKLDLSGNLQPLWQFNWDLGVSSLAMSQQGDYALGARGYVVRLHKRGNGFAAAWYAPRDCITYAIFENDDGLKARCIGAAGTRSFERRRSAPATSAWTSEDGNWMLLPGSQKIFHYNGSTWTQSGDSPLGPIESPRQILTAGNDLVVLSTSSLWLYRSGKWSRISSTDGTCQRLALTTRIAWCLTFNSDRSLLTGTTFDGTLVASQTIQPQAEILWPGLFDDAWFGQKDSPTIGHVTASGTVEQIRLQSPIQAISRSADAIWFTEADRLHYGFVDASNKLRELTWSGPSVLSVRGAQSDAWLEELYQDRRVIIRKVNTAGSNGGGAYAVDVKAFVVAPDGTAWVQSSAWPTILRITEAGEVTRYRLPCFDQHLVLLHGPNNGLWFLSKEPHCSGYVDAAAIHVRDLPMVEYVDYK